MASSLSRPGRFKGNAFDGRANGPGFDPGRGVGQEEAFSAI